MIFRKTYSPESYAMFGRFCSDLAMMQQPGSELTKFLADLASAVREDYLLKYPEQLCEFDHLRRKIYAQMCENEGVLNPHSVPNKENTNEIH